MSHASLFNCSHFLNYTSVHYRQGTKSYFVVSPAIYNPEREKPATRRLNIYKWESMHGELIASVTMAAKQMDGC